MRPTLGSGPRRQDSAASSGGAATPGLRAEAASLGWPLPRASEPRRLLRIFESGRAPFQVRADRFDLVGSADQRSLESRLELEALLDR